MLKNIEIGSKIVYDWYATKEFILVETLTEVKCRKKKGEDFGARIKMINGKYSTTGPLREPTPLELELKEFIGLEK